MHPLCVHFYLVCARNAWNFLVLADPPANIRQGKWRVELIGFDRFYCSFRDTSSSTVQTATVRVIRKLCACFQRMHYIPEGLPSLQGFTCLWNVELPVWVSLCVYRAVTSLINKMRRLASRTLSIMQFQSSTMLQLLVYRRCIRN
jgi:hypothetical protein